jgi:hypothetical protein
MPTAIRPTSVGSTYIVLLPYVLIEIEVTFLSKSTCHEEAWLCVVRNEALDRVRPALQPAGQLSLWDLMALYVPKDIDDESIDIEHRTCRSLAHSSTVL